jgi:hypothetical protein
MIENPIVNRIALLEKFPGKGGWTFVKIPEILPDKKAPFGWVKIRGTIDGIEIKKYHLMPMGNGQLFLPVKAEIRKKITKQQGDYVHIILYRDKEPEYIPQELYDCLADEPTALQKYNNLTDEKQKAIIKWIYSAKNDDIKTNRINETIEKLLNDTIM